jgi:hypothetical protein
LLAVWADAGIAANTQIKDATGTEPEKSALIFDLLIID